MIAVSKSDLERRYDHQLGAWIDLRPGSGGLMAGDVPPAEALVRLTAVGCRPDARMAP